MNSTKKVPVFDRLRRGIMILNDYRPIITSISPIPASFTNGAPDHSRSAYLGICLDNWPVNDPDEKQLKELGWREEQEGEWWTFE